MFFYQTGISHVFKPTARRVFRLFSKKASSKKKETNKSKIVINPEDAVYLSKLPKNSLLHSPSFYYPRLEYYYHNNLLEDQLILGYKHFDDFDEKDLDIKIEELKGDSSPTTLIEKLYLSNIPRIPTFPISQTASTLLNMKWTSVYVNKDKALPSKVRGNIIDQSYLGGGHEESESYLNPIVGPPNERKIPKILKNIPALSYIRLDAIPVSSQVSEADILRAKVLLYILTGSVPKSHPAAKNIISRKIIIGDPIGGSSTIEGSAMYHFIDKTVNFIFPNIVEWKGLNPYPGSKVGSVSFMIPRKYICCYPEFYNSNPKFSFPYDLFVEIGTKSNDINEVITLLTGFQFPFIDNKGASSSQNFVKSQTDPIFKPGMEGYIEESSLTNRKTSTTKKKN